MEQADAQPGERPGAQLFVHVDGGFEAGFCSGIGFLCRFREKVGGFAFAGGFAGWWSCFDGGFGIVEEIEFGLVVHGPFDDGVDDVGLMIKTYLLADELPDLLRTFAGNAAGDDRGAARGEFVEDAQVQVAVEGERELQRYRRCAFSVYHVGGIDEINREYRHPPGVVSRTCQD